MEMPRDEKGETRSSGLFRQHTIEGKRKAEITSPGDLQ